MTIINQLASSLGRRDEVPNQELAMKIVKKKDIAAIKELIENLDIKKLQNDCIKVLYEIGEIDQALIAPYYKSFVDLLKSKNNRMQWGAMSALQVIVSAKPHEIYNSLSAIAEAAAKGTVITKDNFVKLLVKLAAVNKYTDDCVQLLLEQISTAPVNQFPSYAEFTLPLVTKENKEAFIRIVSGRAKDTDQESKLKRIKKVLRKVIDN